MTEQDPHLAPHDSGAAQLPEATVTRLTALDAVTYTTKPWELVVTSRRVRLWVAVAIALVMAVHIFMAFAVVSGDTGTTLTRIDQWAFIGVGLIISAALAYFVRPRVRVNSDGVEVRNIGGTRFYPWHVVYGLSFPESDRWARLELPDFEYVHMYAFQAADGAQVMRDVQAFRALEDRYMPED